MKASRKPITPQSSPPTIKTLARLTGYSIATISKALRNSPVVTEETRRKIFKAAANTGYQVNSRGLALRTGKTLQAAVLMPVTTATNFEWDGVEYTQILQGLSHTLEESPYRIAIYPVRSTAEGLETAQRVVEHGLADGLVFSGILADDPRINYLVEKGFPFVSLGRCRRPLVYAHVDADHGAATRIATLRMIEGGHRRIALINPDPTLSYALDRLDGFQAAFKATGLEVSNDLIVSGDLSTLFGHQSAIALRTAKDPATAFVCVNESTALGVLSGLHSLGLEAGREVDVISFDDINVSAYLCPPLTTLYHPIEAQGRKLGEFLLRRMAGEDPEKLMHVFQPELIIRQPNRLRPPQVAPTV
jgi:DNA-binding LacI/PurR family transcriptional regulator